MRREVKPRNVFVTGGGGGGGGGGRSGVSAATGNDRGRKVKEREKLFRERGEGETT